MTTIEKIVRQINGGCMCNVNYTIPAKQYIRKGATDGSNKTNPLWNRINDIKIERKNVQLNLGVRYEQSANGRLIAKNYEPNFKSEAIPGRTEHNDIHKNICQDISHTKTYIRYMPMDNDNNSTKYTLNGKDVTNTLKPYMVDRSQYSSVAQANAGLKGSEQIVWRTLNIDHVDTIRILGAETK